MAFTTTNDIANTARLFLRVTVAILIGSVVANDASAQARTALGAGRTSLNLSAQLRVGYAMKVSQPMPARVVQRTDKGTVVELPLTAASNTNWTLRVAARADVADDVQVLDASGEWRDLESAEATLSRGQPTNGQAVSLRLRLAPGSDVDSIPALRFVMVPSEF